MSKTTLAAVAAILGLAAIGGGAQAKPAERARVEVRVPVAQVNFRDSASVGDLYARLERAARRACNSRINEFDALEADMACRRAALDAAVSGSGQPMLTAMHETRRETLYARGF